METEVAAAMPRVVASEDDKGLKGGAIGLLSSVVIGVSSTAPAYSLAASLGFVAMVGGMGFKAPAIMIVAFIPMLLIAGAYYYLNKVDPDCGTTFMWTVRAFGPHLGWVTGWVMVAADIIVMASLAQITGSYFFLLFGLNGLSESTFWVTLVGVVFLVIMTIITALGIELAAKVQWGLLGMEFVILVVFSVVALVKVYGGGIADSVRPQWEWFSPFGLSGSTLAGGVLLALFIYWGWDTAVSVNEETERKNIVPGLAAVISTFLLVGIYLLATTAAQAVHGPGFLADNANDVLSPLGTDVLGAWVTKALILAVLTSATASTMTTILPGARTTLSMAAHGAIPKIFSRMSARYQTPVWSTAIYGALSVVWYVGLTLGSANVLADSIAALGLTIAFYYGINGFAAPMLYRHQIFSSVRKFLLLAFFPILGGLALLWAFVQSLIDLWDPANSESGTSWFGVGPPFILGLGFILSGVVVMFVAMNRNPAFFKRKLETVETMVQDTVV